jgi:hypothetical protein
MTASSDGEQRRRAATASSDGEQRRRAATASSDGGVSTSGSFEIDG